MGLSWCLSRMELGEGNVVSQCLCQCCGALGAGFGIIPFTAPLQQGVPKLALHGNGSNILPSLADVKVGEVVKADPGVVVKLANIGDHEGAETY